MKNIHRINGNIYITSDEEITEFQNNIWVYNNGKVWLWQNTMALISNNKPRKIILTTDQDLIKDGVQSIDDTFLEWFVKNPSCEEVEVELFPKFSNKLYGIILPKEEPKRFKINSANTKQMTITLKHYGVTYSIETQSETLDATQVLKTFNNLMLCAGWQQGSIDEAIMELNEQIDL